MNKKRVLIMSVSAGMGHIKAAAALEKTFAADESVVEVINNDALQYTNNLPGEVSAQLPRMVVQDQ
jgi:processive 1,2-diacylglycerol beta-glucosyltransferase